MTALLDAARGHWPSILGALANLSADQLSDTHQPCPLCGGEDRYRFDDLEGSGSWFCNQCGGKDQRGGGGNGMDLLLRSTGWDFATAARRIEAHLGIPSTAKARSKPHRIPDIPPPDAAPPALGRATAQWCYRSPTGHQLFWIQRLDLPPKDGKPARRVYVHRVWLDNRWHYPRSKGPDADAFSCEWPTPRPLYRLPDLYSRPDAPVLIVEGEKAADAAASLFPSAVCISWPNGSKAIGLIDWSPLAGRSITLWPDNDTPGRDAMDRIAHHLTPTAANLHILPAPDDAPEAWDIADAHWTPQEAAAFVRQHRTPYTPQTPHEKEACRPQQAPSHDSPSPEPTPSGAYFTCLGFDQDAYYYQPASTGQVLRLGASSHTSTNLVRLAPLEYWETLYKGKKEDSVHWTKAASDLFIQQGAVGVYNPDRIRGRGAWRDANRTILHLGDRLIVDGITAGISKDIQTTYLYQRLSRLKGPALDNPMHQQESFIVVDLASRFNWEVPASGILLAGWVALAPVCGALRWRPHAWLTAAAGSGKSAILDRFISPLLADMGLLVQGNTTEAGLRQKLRADAMPVVFDEAESNEKRDADRMQSVLALARVASSESQAGLFKGSAGGDAMRFSIRSMFMLSSISTALKQGADRSRFAQLTLRSPGDIPKDERIAHWEALDRDLDRYISHDFARRLQARTVANLPLILESIGVFIRVAARHFDSQRLGDQYGTLLAGAWSLTFDTVPTDEQAQRLIDENNWEPYSAATESPDEERCLQRILEHQIRCETERGTHTRTVSELVEVVTKKIGVGTITNEMAESILGRHGIRVDPDAGQLLISNSAMALAAILRDTAWAHGWGTVLGRLRGAIKTNPIRFRGISGAHRAVAVPLTTIDP